MTEKERKEFKEGLANVKELCVIGLLIMAFFSSCNTRKDAAEVVGNLANLQAVMEEVQEEVANQNNMR